MIEVAYLLASISFIMGLKLLGSAKTARKGMFLAEIGMLLAIAGTLVHHEIVSYEWIVAGLALGTIIGIPLGLWVPMTSMPLFFVMMLLAFAFGVMLVMPIGAADMPVVISILNSYAGLAAAATGFVISNKVLIIAGALDGASRILLSLIMCKAVNA